MGIKKGNPVEFTRKSTMQRISETSYASYHRMGDGEVGIAIEDERPDYSVMVELADGTTYHAKHIHAYGSSPRSGTGRCPWLGIPDELEEAWMKHNPENGWPDDDYY